MPVSPARMDLTVLCRELFDEYRTACPNREICFQFDGEQVGDWDTDRLRQAISNLLGNAVQHGDENASIHLRVTGDTSEVVVLIHKGSHYTSPNLSQTWQNAHDYLFLDSQDEIDALIGYLKTNEANGEKSAFLSFSGDLFGWPAMLNVVTIDVSGFSDGFAAFQTACSNSG